MEQQLDGWFISFTPEEREEVEAALDEGGYEPGPAGFKKMFLDLVSEPPPPEPKSKAFAEYVRQHPGQVVEAANFAVSAIQCGIGQLLKKKKGR